jgi:hypothetical protein
MERLQPTSVSAQAFGRRHPEFGVILNGAVLQAERRACPERAKRAEGISHATSLARKQTHRYPIFYCPVPVTPTVCTFGLLPSVTVTAPVRVPTALGVNVTVNVQVACAASVPLHGVAPPDAAVKSPLPAITGLTDVARTLVTVTVCAALVVATPCAANVSEVGENARGNVAVPLTSRICWLTAALSFTAIPPATVPFAPNAGENVTDIVQLAPAARFRLAAQGFAPLPATANSALAASPLSVTELALAFFTVTAFTALVVPAACAANVIVAGANVSGGVLPPEPTPESAIACGLNELASVKLNAP